MAFEYRLSVRGYELDSYNHVNNAVYVSYFEEARWQVVRELEVVDEVQAGSLVLVVVELNVRYLKEAKIFDPLVVKTTLEIDNPYLYFHQKLYNEETGKLVSKAKVKTLFLTRDREFHDVPASFIEKLEKSGKN